MGFNLHLWSLQNAWSQAYFMEKAWSSQLHFSLCYQKFLEVFGHAAYYLLIWFRNRGGSPRRSFSASNPDRRAKPAVSGDFTNSFSSRREEPSDRFRAAAGRHQSYEETPVPALASVPPPSQLRGESWRNLSSHKPEDTPKGEVWRRPNESTGGSWRTAAEPVSFDSWRNVDKVMF